MQFSNCPWASLGNYRINTLIFIWSERWAGAPRPYRWEPVGTRQMLKTGIYSYFDTEASILENRPTKGNHKGCPYSNPLNPPYQGTWCASDRWAGEPRPYDWAPRRNLHNGYGIRHPDNFGIQSNWERPRHTCRPAGALRICVSWCYKHAAPLGLGSLVSRWIERMNLTHCSLRSRITLHASVYLSRIVSMRSVVDLPGHV